MAVLNTSTGHPDVDMPPSPLSSNQRSETADTKISDLKNSGPDIPKPRRDPNDPKRPLLELNTASSISHPIEDNDVSLAHEPVVELAIHPPPALPQV